MKRNDLKNVMNTLPICFSCNELAYLALTGKVENQVRDKLAYLINQRYKDWRVTREWNRADIAIFKNKSKEPTIIELKAIITFDAVKPKKDPGKELRNSLNGTKGLRPDMKRWKQGKRLKHGVKQVFGIMLAAHPSKEILENLERLKIVKYADDIKKFWPKEERDNKKWLEDCCKKLGKYDGLWDVGRYWGIGMEVAFWILPRKHTRRHYQGHAIRRK